MWPPRIIYTRGDEEEEGTEMEEEGAEMEEEEEEKSFRAISVTLLNKMVFTRRAISAAFYTWLVVFTPPLFYTLDLQLATPPCHPRCC